LIGRQSVPSFCCRGANDRHFFFCRSRVNSDRRSTNW
jgi:hypothetical protein